MALPDSNDAIGIDLGTTNCCVGFVRNGLVEIVPNLNSEERTTPSSVFFNEADIIVGNGAVANEHLHPREVVYDAKRMIGRSFQDRNIQKNVRFWKFRVEEGPLSKPLIEVPVNSGTKKFLPEEISAIILKQLKEHAQKFTGKNIKNAVVTVPAYFSYNQRIATQQAAEKAGLNLLHIINEPTAAAMAYVYVNYKHQNVNKTILIYDLGGGTFDVSVVKITKDEQSEKFQVLATSGDTYLGGRDFDNNLTDYVADKLRKMNIKVSEKTVRRISGLAQNAKLALTEMSTTNMILPYLAGEEDDFAVPITRDEFENINMDLFKKTITITEKALEDSGLNKNRIDEVVLVGGSSKIPRIKLMLNNCFPGIAVSAAISSAEAVAYGATIAAATYHRGLHEKIVDVTPLSLGVDELGDKMCHLIKRNSRIPSETKITMYTVRDKQTIMTFNIYEGERLMAKDNIKLGSFNIDLPIKPMGLAVEILFRIDENGVLQVGAEVESKRYTNVQIQYESTDVAKATNIIEEATLMKSIDNTHIEIVNRINDFKIYIRRIAALCDRAKSKLTKDERVLLLKLAEANINWTGQLDDTSLDKKTDSNVCDKIKSVEAIAEPIFKKYKYVIKGTQHDVFFKFLEGLS